MSKICTDVHAYSFDEVDGDPDGPGGLICRQYFKIIAHIEGDEFPYDFVRITIDGQNDWVCRRESILNEEEYLADVDKWLRAGRLFYTVPNAMKMQSVRVTRMKWIKTRLLVKLGQMK